jgi:hypothetical protein
MILLTNTQTGAREVVNEVAVAAAQSPVGRTSARQLHIGSRGLVAMITLSLAAAFLVGCSARVTVGGNDTVDPARMADTISRQLRKQLPPNVRVGRVVCPKGIKPTEGATFQCTADVAGEQLPVTVTLSHVDTDAGSYDSDFEQAKALLDANKVVEEIRLRLPEQAANAMVDCGTPRVRVVEVGGSLECTVSLGSKRRVVSLVVENVEGTVFHFEPATVWPLMPPKVVKIGDTLTVYSGAGDAELEVTVVRLKFSTGGPFDQPQHGLYMGAYVRARALADGQDVIDIYAIVRGHNYSGDAITGSTAFDPYLEPVPLNTGERTSGWLVFDVPARHGQLVLRDLDGHKVGAWKY